MGMTQRKTSIAMWMTVASDELACSRIGGRSGRFEQRAHGLIGCRLARKVMIGNLRDRAGLGGRCQGQSAGLAKSQWGSRTRCGCVRPRRSGLSTKASSDLLRIQLRVQIRRDVDLRSPATVRIGRVDALDQARQPGVHEVSATPSAARAHRRAVADLRHHLERSPISFSA